MNPRILLIDDCRVTQTYVRGVLTNAGYDLYLASDGTEALPILEVQDIDLVITDILMPEMGGNAVAMHIHQRYPKMKVIGMTSGDEKITAQEAGNMCIHSYFYKIIHCFS